MRRKLTLAALAVLCLTTLFPLLALSQGKPSLAVQGDINGYPVVTLYVAPRDSQGLPLRNLRPEDFQVTEDNQPVTGLEARPIERTAPLTLIMALDVSKSMEGEGLSHLKQATTLFIDNLGPNDRVALYAFSGDVTLVEDFTSDKQKLKDQVDALQVAPATALYNAIYEAADHFPSETTGRRAILVVTDGKNELSGPSRSREEAVSRAKTAKAQVYTVGFGEDKNLDVDGLGYIAHSTGGEFARAPGPGQLNGLFEQVSGQIYNQYRLTYRPSSPPAASKLVRTVVVANTAEGPAAATFEYSIVIPPTQTPLPTPTPSATATATATVTATSTPLPPTATATATAVPIPAPRAPIDVALQWWPWLLVGGLVLIGGGGAWAWWSRRNQPSSRWASYTVVDQPILPFSGGGVGADMTQIQDASSVDPNATQLLSVPAQPSGARLVIEEGPRQGHQYFLSETETTVGRASDRDIIINDSAASRRHARIAREGNQYVLHDEPSVGNATQVNGRAISGPQPLKDGDKVQIGTTVLVFKEK